MSSLVVLGSNGFLGKALLCNSNLIKPIKAIVRTIPINVDLCKNKVTWIEADLMNPSSLIGVLSEGDVVINLAYIPDSDKVKNINLINNIIEACIHSKVSRLIHCSTAVVVGHTAINCVNELSPCNPLTMYEKTKLALEECVLNASLRGLDVGILRPTAILGHGGKNLLKLAYSLTHGNKFKNYLKTCILGNMPMHLVPVRNVVSALLHLALSAKKMKGNIFIVSSDEDKDNNFQKVEEILLEELDINKSIIPQIIFPTFLQVLFFKFINRNDINMYRTYDSTKLKNDGFQHVDSVDEAVRQFSHSIKSNGFEDISPN